MPLYYVVWAAKATAGGYDLLSTRAPRRFLRYTTDRPYEVFPELPADYFGYSGEELYDGGEEQLLDELGKDGSPYSHGRIYLSYDGDLDLHVDFYGGFYRENGYTAVYKLAMPVRPAGIPENENFVLMDFSVQKIFGTLKFQAHGHFGTGT